jgi:hypothetical protein
MEVHRVAAKKEFGRLSVQVTEADITKAKKNDSMMCVVAQSIARTFPKANRIAVDVQTIRWSDEQGRHVYLTPYAVQGYIVAFDAGDEIQPFGFTLDSRKSIPVKKPVHTEAGKAIRNARTKAQKSKARQLRIEEAIAEDQSSLEPRKTPPAVEAELREAATRVLDAEKELHDTTAAYQGHQQFSREGEGAHKSPPRVFKGARERTYGMRLLRVNQPRTG